MTEQTSGIQALLAIHLIITLIISAITFCVTSPSWWPSFFFSQGVLWISLLSLSFSVWLFFLKKNIALLIGVIVFKWPILGVLIYKTTHWVPINNVPFAMGVAPFFASLILWWFLQKDR